MSIRKSSWSHINTIVVNTNLSNFSLSTIYCRLRESCHNLYIVIFSWQSNKICKLYLNITICCINSCWFNRSFNISKSNWHIIKVISSKMCTTKCYTINICRIILYIIVEWRDFPWSTRKYNTIFCTSISNNSCCCRASNSYICRF